MKLILDAEIPLSPPSVNTYWRANGNRRFISDKGVKFKKDMAQYVPYVMSDKRLKAEITFHFATKRKADIDNFCKGLLDSLVSNGLCHDDEQFDVLHIERGPVIKGGLIKIKVFELDVEIN